MFPSNIVLEGLDRTGKSTLIEHWPDTHERHKLGPPPTVPKLFYSYTGYWMRLHGYIPSQRPVIYDRGHVSEIVYGPLYRPDWPNRLVRSWMGEQENVLKRLEREGLRHTVHVFVLGDFNLMKEDERPNANRTREFGRYRMILNASSIPYITVQTYEGSFRGFDPKPTTDGKWRKPENIIDEILEKVKGL